MFPPYVNHSRLPVPNSQPNPDLKIFGLELFAFLRFRFQTNQDLFNSAPIAVAKITSDATPAFLSHTYPESDLSFVSGSPRTGFCPLP